MTGTASLTALRKSRSDARLELAVSRLVEAVNSGPLNVAVCLTDAQEVIALQQEVEALTASLEAERALRTRAERLFADESYLNNELIDLCREHGVPVPRYYFTRKEKV